MPGIAARSGVSLALAGTLLTALFAGGLIAAVGAGRAMDRFGRQPLLVLGSLANGLGCLSLAFALNWPQALSAAALMGIGDATLVVGYHVLFADLYPQSSGSALNRLNVLFGVGALVGPALAGISILISGDIRYVLVFVALAQAAGALVLVRSAFPALRADPHGAAELGLRQLVRLPLLWLLALLLFLYVALEAGLGGWTYTYLHQDHGFGVVVASLLTSGYWVGLTLGRLFSPLALRRTSNLGLLAVVTGGTALASILLVACAGWRPGAAVCIILVGLGFGPVWPLVLAVSADVYRHGAGAASGLLTAGGSVGGLVGPWLQGVLLHRGAYLGLAFTLVGSAGMFALAALVRHRLRVRPMDEGRDRSLTSSTPAQIDNN